jgi:putative ABC transport system permease protein
MRASAALAAAVVLALGIGLVTAMFAIADPYILRPLPYANPAEIVVMEVSAEGAVDEALVPTFETWRGDRTAFKALAAVRQIVSAPIEQDDGFLPFTARQVTQDFFAVLGIPAPHPLDWLPQSESAGAPIVLTPYGQRRLPRALAGTTLRHETGSYVVVGLLPDTFVMPSPEFGRTVSGLMASPPADFPVVPPPGAFGGRRSRFLARMAEGMTPRVLEERLSHVLADGRLDVRVETLSTHMTRQVRPYAWGAVAAGVLILLVCAGNVANLSLVRAAYRMREFATREAIGASRADIARLWMLEHALLALIAAGLGLAVAAVALLAVDRVLPEMFATLGPPSLTGRAVLFAALCGTAVAAIAFAPTAALLLSRPSVRAGGGAGVARAGKSRLAFMGAQCALAMILAIAAAMLIQSYYRLLMQDTGYDPAAAAVTVSYPFAGRGSVGMPLIEETLAHLKRVPGVRAVGVSATNVVGSGVSKRAMTIGGETIFVDVSYVSTEFFAAAGMTTLRGRALSDVDRSWRGVVVNEAFARAFLARAPGPIGEPISVGGRQSTIVGLVRDAFDRELDVVPTPTVYATLDAAQGSAFTYVLSPGSAATQASAALRRAVVAEHPRAVVGEVQTIRERHLNTVRDQRFATLVLSLFGAAGAAVCVTGIVGLVAFIVGRRTSEIAVRMALGARPADVRRLVLREAVGAAVVGGAAGLLAGRWLSLSLEHLVYGVTAGNWTTTLAAGALMLAVVVLASLVPAQRAVNLPPSLALRAE